MARLGLLGGTFNPPHMGHLVCATQARAQLGLDRVLLVPVRTAPHKEVADEPGPEVRARLCELAAAGDPGLAVSRIELDRAGPSFTVDTLRELHERAPGDELTFIVGGDMAHSLPRWREPEAILELARLGVAEREGIERDDVLEQLSALPRAADRIHFFDMPRLDISSTRLRRSIAAGAPVRYLVPDAVIEEIQARGLYA